MNISVNNRIKYKNKKKAEFEQRVLTGKKAKITLEERQAACEKAQRERDEWEANNLGGYEKIFPFDDPIKAEENYDDFMKAAHKWWEEWTGTATKKLAKRSSLNENGKLPPMVFGQGAPTSNQNAKSKDLQASSAQKLKLGPLPQKVLSNQKLRMTVTNNIKQNESSDDISSGKGQNPEVVQSSTVDGFDSNSLTQCRIVEDERDDRAEVVPILEQDSMIESSLKEDNAIFTQNTVRERNLSPSVYSTIQTIKVQDKALSASKASCAQTDSITSSIYPTDQSKTSFFRIKKTNGVLYGRETPDRITPVTFDKENSKASFFKASGPGNISQQKTGTSYLSSGPISSINSLPERSESIENILGKRAGSLKATFKLSSGGLGETAELESLAINRVKSSNYLESEKMSHRDDLLKTYKKKILSSLSQQKTNNGNFLTPRLFEMSFQGSKGDLPKPSLIGGQLYTGLKSVSDSLSF